MTNWKRTEHRNFRLNGTKDLVTGTKISCEGRRDLKDGSTVWGSIDVSYNIPDFRDGAVTIHWDFAREIDISWAHGSASGNPVQSSRALAAAITHAADLVASWSGSWEDVFEMYFDHDETAERNWWTEVDCEEWRTAKHVLDQEQADEKRQVFWKHIDPNNDILYLVKRTIERLNANKSLVTQGNSSNVFALRTLWSQGSMNRFMTRRFEESRVSGHLAILRTCDRVLSSDTSKKGLKLEQDIDERIQQLREEWNDAQNRV